MFYWLYELLAQYDIPGLGMIPGITFRAGGAIILSLLITTVFGSKLIRILQRMQIGEEVRDLGLEGQMQKKGTPTMGGIIILLRVHLNLEHSTILQYYYCYSVVYIYFCN